MQVRPQAVRSDVEQDLTVITLPADQAARVLWNACLFSTTEKGTMRDEVYVETNGEIFAAVGADAYSAGADYAKLTEGYPEHPELGRVDNGVFLNLKTAKALERSIRARGAAEVTLTFTPEGIEYDGSLNEAVESKQTSGWSMIWYLLTTHEPPEGFGKYLEVNAKRLAQFGSVRTSKDYPLSLYVQSERVWHVRVGPTFRGLLCPLDRATLIERFGDEASRVMWGVVA